MKSIKKICLVFVVIFTVLLFVSCDSAAAGDDGIDVETEWETAPASMGISATRFFTFTAFIDKTWEISITMTTGGDTRTDGMYKGTFTGDTTKDTSASDKVELTFVHMWDTIAEEWKPLPSTRKADVTIVGQKLSIADSSGFPSFKKQ